MHKIFFVLPLYLSAMHSIAQSTNSDSLKKVMDSYTNKDTVRVKKMADYANSMQETSPSEAITVSNEAIELAKSLQWNRGLIRLYSIKASAESILERYDASIADLLVAQKIAEDNHFTEMLAGIHLDLSESYRLMDDTNLCSFHVRKALEISTAQKDEKGILNSTFALAVAYEAKNQWDSVLSLLKQAMELAIKLNDEKVKQWIIGLRVDHLASIKDYTNAVQLFRQTLWYDLKNDNKHGVAWDYSVLSNFFSELNDKDSAYYYAEQALHLSKNYNLAKELRDAYQTLYICHYKFGDYKNALEYRLLYDSLYNATFNLQAGQNAERAKMQLEQERKDTLAQAEKIKKEAETKRTRNLLFGAIAFFILIAGFLYWNSLQKQKAKLKIEKAFGQLKSTQAQLIQSEKMASLGELTAGIAHEIQNPLNFVNNFSEVNSELIGELVDEVDKGNLEDAKAIAADIKQNLEKINHHGKRADAIVKGMLQHSRTSSGLKESTDINVLCDEYLRLAYHGLRAKDKSFNAKFETEFDQSIGKINIVPQDIARVLLNLINNAFYAVNEKQKLCLNGYEPSVIIITTKQNGKVEIIVKDNGNGIPQNVVEKIFQPFFTTKPTGQGTGLGLSLAYDIIKAHGGEMKVETREGEGSEFIIQMPV